MPHLVSSQRPWLEEHGRREASGWVCKAHGAPINFKSFPQSVPNPCFGPADFLEGRDGNPIHRDVLVLYCTRCDPEPAEIPPGEIVEVRG